MKKNILILGAGNMVSALFSSLSGEQYNFYVYTPSGVKAEKLSKVLKGNWVKNLKDLKSVLDEDLEFFDMVFLGFKPQMFLEASKGFKEDTGFKAKNTTVVSMLAGTPVEVIQKTFQLNRVIRIMPNTPSLMKMGVTLVLPSKEVEKTEISLLEELLKPSGTISFCKNEDQLDQVTSITGSGPAYIFEFARLMTEFLKSKGLKEGEASRLVAQLFLGSSKMLSESEDDFETLRNKVTSPNGVTFEALEVFKVDKLGETFDRAFEKNFSRSLELREEALKMNL